jgi:predicted ABC-class ATPase
VHLPLRDGRILGAPAKQIFFDELPVVVNAALLYCNLDAADLEDSVNLMEDADQVRQALPTRGLVSFVREGALVARRGLSDLPDFTHAAGIQMKDAQRVDIETPNGGVVKGLGIPAGITVILGDDYSGRIELMKSIAAGIYNHIAGDGREMVITMPDAVYISAQGQRGVQRVDISPFVRSESAGRDFSSPAAAAAAAQAASVVEAIEVGARVLILDESDSAPGFLAQDQRLAGLGAESPFGVMPFTGVARKLADEMGVSVIVGGLAAVADFVAVADTVLFVENYAVTDVTKHAKELALKPAASLSGELAAMMNKARWVVPSSIDASVGRHDAEIEAQSLRRLRFGRNDVDLSDVYQLADAYQTATIGLILHYARLRYLDEGRPLRELLDLVDRDLSTEGLDVLSRDLRGDLARPRRYEIAAALNRMAGLRISHSTSLQ